MSSDVFEAWFYGGNAYDRRARRALEEQAAADQRSRSMLRQQMQAQHGNLQAQINRLAEAFVALVEYEDVRGELGQHADAAAVRRHAREVVAGWATTGGANLTGLAAPADVPGYWLAPAARGVVATAAGDPEATALLAEASRRDAGRTSTFLVLLDALRRESRWTAEHLAATLPRAAEVTVAQRVLWIAIADGRLGEDAQVALTDALSAPALVSSADRVSAWLAGRVTKRRDAIPAEKASHALAELRQVLTGQPAGPTERQPLAALCGALAVHEAAAPASEDPTADCVVSLVDEGAPAEADILRRMAEARAGMGFVDPRDTTTDWDAPRGTVADLLLADLADADHGAQQALARRVLARPLRAVADALLAETRAPVPTERQVMLAGRREVAVTAAGTRDETWWDDVTTSVAADTAVATWMLPTAIGLSAASTIGLVLGILSGWFLALAVLTGVGAGYVWFGLYHERSERTVRVESAVRRASHDVEAASRNLRECQARTSAASTAASGHYAAVVAVLGPAPSPVS